MRQFTLICLVGLLLGCGASGEQKTVQLQRAADLHLKAIAADQALQPELNALVQQKNQINIQGRSLSPEELAFVAAVDQLEQRYAYWEEHHIEVPGFEHAGHEGHAHHDHDHAHGPALELTPADQLIVQQEFLDSILVIQKDIQALKSRLESLQAQPRFPE